MVTTMKIMYFVMVIATQSLLLLLQTIGSSINSTAFNLYFYTVLTLSPADVLFPMFLFVRASPRLVVPSALQTEEDGDHATYGEGPTVEVMTPVTHKRERDKWQKAV